MSPEGAPSPPEFFRELLSAGASAFALDLDAPALSALGAYLTELDRWRRAMDLTGPLSAQELASHALESAFGASMLPAGARVLDIGSGGGFPGVPLAIVRPDLAMTALEPRAKRAEFLRHTARTVPVPNLRVLEARLDASGTEPWDAATIRAVGDLPEILGPAAFLRPRGVLLAWTTEPEALASQLSSRFQLERVEPLPGTRRRAIALYRKAVASPRSRQDPEGATFPVERSG